MHALCTARVRACPGQLPRIARVWCAAIVLGLAVPIPGTAQELEGLVNIRFQLDIRTFAVLATINAAGFDLDIDRIAENPARSLVRQRLSTIDSALRRRLRDSYATRAGSSGHAEQQSRYISFSLFLGGPPEFTLMQEPESLPAEVKGLVGFETLVRELWVRGNLESTWKEVRPFYVAEMRLYRPLIRKMILGCLQFMRTEARVALDRQVLFAAVLLNGFGIVNARNIDREYHLFVGPSSNRQESMRSVRHEYLHFMIDPMVAKYRAHLPDPEAWIELVRQVPTHRPRYENFEILLAESLIRSLELHLDQSAPEPRRRRVIALYEEGMVLSPYFDEALARFRGAKKSLQEHMPSIIQGIQIKKEKRRTGAIARWKAELETQDALARNDSEKAARIRALLVDANALLESGQMKRANGLLARVLELEGQNPHALFGLAQIAAADQRFEAALELYSQAAEASGKETWIRAWSGVRRGKIFHFLGEEDRAVLEWRQVLGLEGDLRGAREAARESVKQRATLP